MSATRVLVTGAHGLLGASLVPQLRANEFEVIEAPSRTRAAQSSDLSLRRNVARVLDEVRPELVVNLAALADVDYCESHPDEAFATNAAMVRHIAEWIAASSPACALVHISSDQMYDGKGPHDESALRPCNYYGFSKVISEQYAAIARATTLRTNFFGRSRSPGRASLSDWIVDAARQGRTITVFDDVYFSPLSTTTLSEAIVSVAARPVEGVFNLGSSEGMSKADFAFALVEELGLPTSHMVRGSANDAPRTARRPRDIRMSSASFHAEWGGAAPTLAEEIRRAAQEYE